MNYYKQFELFNPLTDRPPENPIVGLIDIVTRAGALLNNRTLNQLIAVAETIDWMIDDAVETAIENFEQEEDVAEPHRTERSDVSWLDATLENHDIEHDPDFNDARDYEYFAVLALWKIADALLALYPSAGGDRQWSSLCLVDGQRTLAELSNATASALEAMEAVCVAERRKEIGFLNNMWQNPGNFVKQAADESIHEQVRKKISVQASKAAIKSHAADYKARARAIELYKQKKYASVDAAAAMIAPQVFKSTRTVAKWLYDERKGRTPSIPTDLD